MDLPEAYNNERCGTLDQKIMDLAIRGPVQTNVFIAKWGGIPACPNFPPDQKALSSPPNPLNWDYVPVTVLENYLLVIRKNLILLERMCGVALGRRLSRLNWQWNTS